MKNLSLFILALIIVSCSTGGIEQKSEDNNIPKNEDGQTVFEKSDLDSVAISIVEKDTLVAEENVMEADSLMVQGMNIKFLKKGEGEKVMEKSVVKIHFKSMLSEDKVIEDSKEIIKEPVAIMQGIKMLGVEGLDIALLELREGDKVKFNVPSELAYGNEKKGPIPANSEIFYEIEVLDVVEPQVTETGVKVYRVNKLNGGRLKEGNTVGLDYYAYAVKTNKLYDNSRKNNKSFDFEIGSNKMMPGLNDALVYLKEGEHAYVYVPSERAFGAAGLKDMVPSGSDVVFKLHVDYKK